MSSLLLRAAKKASFVLVFIFLISLMVRDFGSSLRGASETTSVDRWRPLTPEMRSVLTRVTLLVHRELAAAKIFSTWRSGSSFLGGLLHYSIPATFYHYEPFFHHGIRQLEEDSTVQREMIDLLQCNYDRMTTYLEASRLYPDFLDVNTRVMMHCKDKSVCLQPVFLNAACEAFPVHLVKTVRVRLSLAKAILGDKSFDDATVVLLLVRDPRGTMLSRKRSAWCVSAPDCNDRKRLCSDMTKDLSVARELMLEYPNNFRLVRYEDLVVDPFGVLSMVPNLPQEVLQSIKSSNSANASSVFRWKKDMGFEEVKAVQEKCMEVMDMLGYRRYESEEDLLKMDPVLPLPIL